jgi:hypothetical protein
MLEGDLVRQALTEGQRRIVFLINMHGENLVTGQAINDRFLQIGQFSPLGFDKRPNIIVSKPIQIIRTDESLGRPLGISFTD